MARTLGTSKGRATRPKVATLTGLPVEPYALTLGTAVYLGDKFYTLDSLARAQTLIHEGMHTLGFNDIQLATAAGWTRTPNMSDLGANLDASSYLQGEVAEHCK